jgi:nucleoside-diphosphate-sugar epimerase
MSSGAPWVLIGCGYTGAYLARALVGRKAPLTVTRRDRTAAEEMAQQLEATGAGVDLGDPSTLEGVIPDGAIVVCLAPPGHDPAFEIATLVKAAQRAAKLVYISSTGVYAPANGEWVDERWPVAPTTASGKARVAAESALAAASIPVAILRVAGIHGPGRKMADRIREGTHRVIGDGSSHVSRIHVVDLVAAIVAAGTKPVTGVINIADDDPSPIGEVADAFAQKLGVPPSPRVPADSVSPEVAGMLTANRRIANQRMKTELGVELRYKSWRDGL